jgi:GT2 family glycosyltransferase
VSGEAASEKGVAAVAIGRNEGERLVRCLDSLAGRVEVLVYVDSGSADGSVERARERGAALVELDPTQPFTAARARNAGLERALELCPDIELVQFVDGDCEVRAGWIADAATHLRTHPERAAVCGRRRERHPDASVYNRCIDLEWDTPTGVAVECGGDAMFRVEALRSSGGFCADLIAGEEPELCLRLRRAGYTIYRMDAEMTLHDAALTRFSQWWQRTARSGHAYAEGAWRHGRGPERFRVRELVSILAWGGALPAACVAVLAAAALGALPFALGAATGLGGLALYPLLWLRIARREQAAGATRSDAALWASACVLAKPAQLQGAVQFAWNHLARGRSTGLIEYKGAAAVSGRPSDE